MVFKKTSEFGWWVFVVIGCLSCSINSEHAATKTGNSNARGSHEGRFSDHPTTMTHMQVLDYEHWLISDQVRLWRTEDRGRTWIPSYSPEEQHGERLYIRGISFISDQNGFLVDRDTIFRTDNGGAEWYKVGTVKTEGAEYFINNCYFVDSIHGWAAGLMFRKDFMSSPKAPPYIGAILCTKDGGTTWERQRLKAPDRHPENNERWDLKDILFLTEKIGWAVGDTVIYWTVDGGEHWLPARTNGAVCERVSFIDELHGWITMRDTNAILASSDGGRNWTIIPAPAPFIGVPTEVVFLTPQHGFAACVYLYETTNGGLTWRQRSDLQGIAGAEYTNIRRALDSTLLVIGGGNKTFSTLASTDYGKTFEACCSDEASKN